jgi:hypothetical protein
MPLLFADLIIVLMKWRNEKRNAKTPQLSLSRLNTQNW